MVENLCEDCGKVAPEDAPRCESCERKHKSRLDGSDPDVQKPAAPKPYKGVRGGMLLAGYVKW